MRLIIVGSGSDGNCYILDNGKESLIIEAGMPVKQILKALDFNLKKVVGCLITHDHGDHAKYAKDLMSRSIPVWATQPTHVALGTDFNHYTRFTWSGDQFQVGNFTIKAFDVKHAAAEPVGYLIHHPEMGMALFMTDTCFCPYKFNGLSHAIIEANYCERILQEKLEAGETNKVHRDHVLTGHMSIDTCKNALLSYDLKTVKNIVLIHLSNDHSDESRFKQIIQGATGKMVHVAANGMTLDNFNQ